MKHHAQNAYLFKAPRICHMSPGIHRFCTLKFAEFGEAPSQASPMHTSEMGRSWCQPKLLHFKVNDSVFVRSLFQAHHHNTTTSDQTFTKPYISSTQYPALTWNKPGTKTATAVSSVLWWYQHKCRSKSHSMGAWRIKIWHPTNVLRPKSRLVFSKVEMSSSSCQGSGKEKRQFTICFNDGFFGKMHVETINYKEWKIPHFEGEPTSFAHSLWKALENLLLPLLFVKTFDALWFGRCFSCALVEK